MAKKETKPVLKKEEKEERREIAPYRPMMSLWTEMDRWFDDMREEFEDRFWRPLPSLRREGVEIKMPTTDIIDNGDGFEVRADMPGIPKGNVKVEVTSTGIEISGEARKEEKKEGKEFVRKERTYSSFYRTLAFPEEVIPEKAEATMEHGVLKVNVPKKEPKPEPKRQKVEVK